MSIPTPDHNVPRDNQQTEAAGTPQWVLDARLNASKHKFISGPIKEERHVCTRCGGEGFIEYNDGDPSDWGEDCPSEINHLIVCRACGGTGREP